MQRKVICILLANLFAGAAPAWGQSSGSLVTGSVGVGGIWVDEEARDASKLNEYRDLDSGVLFEFDIKGRGARYWWDAFGENLGRDDQYVMLRGGSYDVFKYKVWTDSLRHNFVFGGITPYAGAGSSPITATFPSLNTATWNRFDGGFKRRDDGGFVEFQGANPWYFRVDANQVSTKGTYPGASAQGTSPGNGFPELMFPVDYKTRNLVVEGGYNTLGFRADLSWMVSQFENSEESLFWTNGFFANALDRTYLPADNRYNRIAGNATWRQLPGNTTLSARFTVDELKSSVEVGTTQLGSGGVPVQVNPSVSTYQGKVSNGTFSVAASSMPTRGLDTRVYFNYRERDDESTHVSFSTGHANEQFSYEKTNFGFDAFWRINRGNRVGGGYDFLETDRKGRSDYDATKDKRIFLEYKNTMVDELSARLKYTRLERDSDFLLANGGSNPNDFFYWERYKTAFDLANVNQDQWKLMLDWSPMPSLDVGFEGIIKSNDYEQNTLGRLKDDRREIYVNVSYVTSGGVRLTAFGDHEEIKYDSRHRIVGNSALAGAYDPFAPANASNYNWTGNIKDRNWAAGFAVDWPATEKLVLKASAIYYKGDGSVDLAVQEGTPTSVTRPLPVGNWDDSRRTAFTLRGDYAFSKSLSFKFGYSYEKLDYSDSQYDGYLNVISNSNASATSYLTGVYAFPQYNAHIAFGMLSWKF